jgi:feruloyl-CoA synthase
MESATGSSTRIMRAVLLDTPLSIDRGEVTDKGSINQRAVLTHRAELVEAMHDARRNDPLVIYATTRGN